METLAAGRTHVMVYAYHNTSTNVWAMDIDACTRKRVFLPPPKHKAQPAHAGKTNG